MARITNLATLETAVSDWLWRTGDPVLAGRADAFVDLFERGFKRDQRLPEMQTIFTTTITSGVVSLSPGFLELIRVQITGEPNGVPNQILEYVTPDTAALMEARQSPDGGPARHYTILANNLYITPRQQAPIGATLEISMYVFNQLYLAPQGINWLISAHPDVYLFGTLLQAAAFIDDDGMIARWETAYNQVAESLQASGRRKKTSGSPLTVRASTGFIGGHRYARY